MATINESDSTAFVEPYALIKVSKTTIHSIEKFPQLGTQKILNMMDFDNFWEEAITGYIIKKLANQKDASPLESERLIFYQETIQHIPTQKIYTIFELLDSIKNMNIAILSNVDIEEMTKRFIDIKFEDVEPFSLRPYISKKRQLIEEGMAEAKNLGVYDEFPVALGLLIAPQLVKVIKEMEVTKPDEIISFILPLKEKKTTINPTPALYFSRLGDKIKLEFGNIPLDTKYEIGKGFIFRDNTPFIK